MLIAISGSQSSGKSTILSNLKELGYNTIDRKTSRSILKEWDISLEEVNSNAKLALRFQQEIIYRKHQDELSAYLSSDLFFTERTYADLMTYFLVSFGKLNDFSAHINSYYTECIKNQQQYSKVFYLRAGHFVPEKDGVRGDNVHYSRMIDLVMLDLTKQMTKSDKLNILETPCLDQRLNIILAHSGLL
ncbi:MAG: AAA family ATPase [Nitrososphaeraceae archaeon]